MDRMAECIRAMYSNIKISSSKGSKNSPKVKVDKAADSA